MARLKPQKFTLEQFQDQGDWIGKLFGPLNQLTNDIFLAFNNNLTISDNLSQEIKEIKFKNSTVNFPLVFQTKFNSNPMGINVIYIYNNTLSAYSTTAPHLQWIYLNGLIKITAITGLTADSTYTMRLHAIYS